MSTILDQIRTANSGNDNPRTITTRSLAEDKVRAALTTADPEQERELLEQLNAERSTDSWMTGFQVVQPRGA